MTKEEFFEVVKEKIKGVYDTDSFEYEMCEYTGLSLDEVVELEMKLVEDHKLFVKEGPEDFWDYGMPPDMYICRSAGALERFNPHTRVSVW